MGARGLLGIGHAVSGAGAARVGSPSRACGLGSRAGDRRRRRGRGGRAGSGRALALLGVVLLPVVGCGARLAISGPAPRAEPLVWRANEVVCVVQPADGRAGDTVYYGSGAAVVKRIADVIRAHRQVKVISVDDRSDPRACAARHGTYAVVPVVLRWERHSGALFYTESAKLELSLQRSDQREVLRTVGFEMRNSQPNVLISPHDLLPKEFDDAVLRLLPSG